MKKIEPFLKKHFSEYKNAKGIAEKLEVAIKYILEEKGKTFEQIPWETQFLPIVIKHIFRIGYLKNVNPGMSHFSGMIDIPKSEINKHLPKKYLPKTILCTKDQTLLQILRKKKSLKIMYPIICKPNTGERSSGVKFITNDTELAIYKDESEKDFLLQDFCPYTSEFGVAVERKKATHFSITSLAEKQTPTIVGDGKNTIKELIKKLKVTKEQQAKILENASATELEKIPEKKEHISIVRTASISLGTKIIDIRDKITPALEKKVSEVLKGYKDFNMGRFDIKANSLEDILKGKFIIIELNGINGIPMHVYDDKFSLEEKYQEIKAYFNRIHTFALKNQEEKQLRRAWFLPTAFFFWRAIKAQPKSKELKKERKKDLRIIRKFFFRAELNRLKEGVKKFLRFS